jgi:BirA family biotin operon repressor/biotin-[acetyl-CoA-carboxylase] ligase
MSIRQRDRLSACLRGFNRGGELTQLSPRFLFAQKWGGEVAPMGSGNGGQEQRKERKPKNGSPLPLDVEAIRSATHDVRLGRPLLYFPVIGSTSTRVMELARAGAAPGILVIADEQTAGRGRIGHTWTSLSRRQLEFSLLLKPDFPPHFLVMASAVAVAEAIAAVAGIQAGIKWPNDIEVEGRKVTGILIETIGDIAVLGIGVNVSGSLSDDPLLAPTAITLADAAGREISRELLFIDLLRRFDVRYADLSSNGNAARAALFASWRERLVTLGRRISVRQGECTLSGIAEDVDTSGALFLRLDDGTQVPVHWGDVSSA